MSTLKTLGFAAALVTLGALYAQGAPTPTLSNDVGVCDPYFPQNCIRPNPDGSINTSGGGGGGSGFTPNGNYATLTASASSGSVALPTGTTVQFQNTGSSAVSCVLGIGSATATASKLIIQPAGQKSVTVGANTFGACIDQTGSASNVVVLAGGTGPGNDTGGGGGSGGGGGAVTVADGADVAQGTTTDPAWSSGAGTVIGLLKKLASSLIAPGQAVMASSMPVAIASDQSAIPVTFSAPDPCQTTAKLTFQISQTASTKLITGTAAKKIRICSIIANGADAENMSLVEGTGTVCATGIAAVLGSTTAANGMNFAANGGFSHGNGGYTVLATATAADDFCLLQSGSGRVAGAGTYVLQ